MATLTPNLGITQLEPGVNQAHVTVNEALVVLDRAIAGLHIVDFGSSDTIELPGGDSTNAIIIAKNAPSNAWIVVQNKPKIWVFLNRSGHDVTVQVPGQATTVPIPDGETHVLVCDGDTGITVL
jgi:hypothetical protein